MGDISPNFSRSEFKSKSRTGPPVPYPPEWIDERLRPLCRMLEVIRAAAGRPLHVVSGYRTPAHNVAVGGAKASRHVEGDACDISYTPRPSDTTPEEVDAMHALIVKLHAEGKLAKLGGLGRYGNSGWCHVDTRPRPKGGVGPIAMWGGSGIGSEVTS